MAVNSTKSNLFSTRVGAAKLFIGVVITLIILKALVAWITGSISILAQLADSFLDLVSGIVTYSAVRISTKPADTQHPYGHGKAENIGSMTQGILILIAGILIIYSAVGRIRQGATVQLAEAGIAVMLVSMIISIFLSRHLLKVARATESDVLEANASNINSDIYSASAVLVGLLLVRITRLNYIDAIIAIAVSIYILTIAYRVLYRSFAGLMDVKLSPQDEGIIKSSLADHSEQIAGYHKLRTREAGGQHYIDVHLVMNKDISLEHAHKICDEIETEIEHGLSQASVTIHAEPCSSNCRQCQAICNKRRRK